MPDIDIGQLSEAINDKMDRDLNNRANSSGFRKLIESYSNGANWYKVFEEIQSDGTTKLWCEQGQTVTRAAANTAFVFLKPFCDTNYTLILGFSYGGSNTTVGYKELGYYDKNTLGFLHNTNVTTAYISSVSFYACGYINQGD